MHSDMSSFGDLFANRDFYSLPDYQRSSSWGPKQHSQFLRDILDIASNNIFVAKTDNKGLLRYSSNMKYQSPLPEISIQMHPTKSKSNIRRYEIGDGQQRITTAAISLAALCWAAHLVRKDIAASSIDAQQLQELEERIFSTSEWAHPSYLGMPNPGKNLTSSPTIVRLSLTVRDNEALDNVIRNGPTAISKKSENTPIYSAFKLFYDAFLEEASLYKLASEKFEFFSKIELAITKGFVFALYSYSEDENMLRHFSKMNSLGIELTNAELIKPLFLGSFAEGDREKYAKDWSDSYENDFWMNKSSSAKKKELDRLDEALYYIALSKLNDSSLISKSQRNGIYDAWEEMFNQPGVDYNEAYRYMKQSLSLYRTLIEHNVDIKDIRLLKARDAYYRIGEIGKFKPIMSIIMKLYEFVSSEKDFEQCIKMIESYSIRKMLSNSPLTNLHDKLLRHIGKGFTSKDLEKELTLLSRKSAWEGNRELRNILQNKAFSKKDYPILAIVLADIENKRSSTKGSVHFLPLKDTAGVSSASQRTLEHVLPQAGELDESLGEKPWFKETKYDHLVNMLGNLTIITRKVNSTLSNKNFEEKKKSLKKENLADDLSILKEVLKETKWTEAEIIARTNKLIEEILTMYEGPETSNQGSKFIDLISSGDISINDVVYIEDGSTHQKMPYLVTGQGKLKCQSTNKEFSDFRNLLDARGNKKKRKSMASQIYKLIDNTHISLDVLASNKSKTIQGMLAVDE